MNTEAALLFLQQNQPMPPDTDLTDEIIGQYDAVRRHFARFPDERAIPLLLNSFGSGSGFGVYQLVEDTILAHERSRVIDALKDAIQSPHASVRRWSLEIAALYNDRSIGDVVKSAWVTFDEDSRFWAAHVIVDQYADEDQGFVKRALEQEEDPDIRAILEPLVS